MKKELNIYTEISNAEVQLMSGNITRSEARDVYEGAMWSIAVMRDGEKKDVLRAKAHELKAML